MADTLQIADAREACVWVDVFSRALNVRLSVTAEHPVDVVAYAAQVADSTIRAIRARTSIDPSIPTDADAPFPTDADR